MSALAHRAWGKRFDFLSNAFQWRWCLPCLWFTLGLVHSSSSSHTGWGRLVFGAAVAMAGYKGNWQLSSWVARVSIFVCLTLLLETATPLQPYGFVGDFAIDPSIASLGVAVIVAAIFRLRRGSWGPNAANFVLFRAIGLSGLLLLLTLSVFGGILSLDYQVNYWSSWFGLLLEILSMCCLGLLCTMFEPDSETGRHDDRVWLGLLVCVSGGISVFRAAV